VAQRDDTNLHGRRPRRALRPRVTVELQSSPHQHGALGERPTV